MTWKLLKTMLSEKADTPTENMYVIKAGKNYAYKLQLEKNIFKYSKIVIISAKYNCRLFSFSSL